MLLQYRTDSSGDSNLMASLGISNRILVYVQSKFSSRSGGRGQYPHGTYTVMDSMYVCHMSEFHSSTIMLQKFTCTLLIFVSSQRR